MGLAQLWATFFRQTHLVTLRRFLRCEKPLKLTHNFCKSAKRGSGSDQGCQMVCFQISNDLVKFWRALQWKILVYFLTIWSILRPLQIFYGHMSYFVVIWYVYPRFGILYQEKSGNPGSDSEAEIVNFDKNE
jgi:hypothetical protein